MKRHELTDEQWDLIKPFIPVSRARTGRPARDRRTLLNAIFWILHTGAPWRDLPERFGPWQTAYHHFNTWRQAGVFDRILKEAYKRRAVAEQCVGRLKECRRVGTRFEKLNINFHAMVNLAIIK